VFVVNGQTRSKFYSSERFIDDTTVSLFTVSDTPGRHTDAFSTVSIVIVPMLSMPASS
jgi:hypothetical protein